MAITDAVVHEIDEVTALREFLGDSNYEYPLVLISGQGRSGIGKALTKLASTYGYRVVNETEWDYSRVSIAVCLHGYMEVGYTEEISPDEIEKMVRRNYLDARDFSETVINHWRETASPGYLIIVGSIAAKAGNTGAVDYAAMKAAINKYAELRGREVRGDGIRVTVVNFGGVDSGFWRDVDSWPEELRKSIAPDPKKALSKEDAAEYLLSLFSLPERVAVKECTVVSMEYQ